MAEVAVSAPGMPIWVDLASRDLERAKTFYSKLFGWQPFVIPDPKAGGYTMLRLNGKDVAAVSPAQGPDQPAAWSVYFATDNADATARAVREAGGRVIAEPFDVLDSGRMAAFTDPTGAFFSVWQPREHKGFQSSHAPNSYTWSELNTRGFEKAKPFYQKVFGWGAKTNPMGEGAPPYTEWQIKGKSIGGGWEMPKEIPASVPPHWMNYFAVRDVDAGAKKISELGGKVMMGPQDFPGGRFAIATDLEGAAFGVLFMKG